MRQPFWIVNISLLVLVLAVTAFIYFAQQEIPERKNIEPAPYRRTAKTETATFNVSKIYEYDLFDTFQKELESTEFPEQVGPLPDAPMPMAVRVPEEPKPQFIEPLPITLKGIVVILTDDTKNRAIIMDNRTNKELSYKVGDMIEDAQLVRIFSNKIILMRANGQQEVLYLREKDAKLDPTYTNINNWQEIITPTGPNTYTINASEFVTRMQSLGQFIDTLEIITAYRQGESIGVRATNISPGTLGQALGISKDDVIIKINDIAVSQTQNRLAIYNQILGLKTDDVIRVSLLRNNQEIVLQYTLQAVQQPRRQEIGAPVIPDDGLTQAQRKVLESKHTFAPTLGEIRNKEKANILEKGNRPTRNVLSNLNE